MGLGPSQVKVMDPASFPPETMAAMYSPSSMALPMLMAMPATGATKMGIRKRRPKKS